MKSSPAVLAAVIAHAVLIGLLMGMTHSPVVGAVLPLLLGLGGYRLLDALFGIPAEGQKPHPMPRRSSLGWTIALWCAMVVAGVFTGIALRSGAVSFGPARVTTLSLIDLNHQPAWRIPDLALIAAYCDRLEMSDTQRGVLARALSDTTLEAKPVLSSLQELFAKGGGPPPATTSGYEIFQFHRQAK